MSGSEARQLMRLPIVVLGHLLRRKRPIHAVMLDYPYSRMLLTVD